LAKTCGPLEDRARERLGAAERASFRARELTQQLLTFSKGGKPVKRVVFMGPLVRESCDFALRGANIDYDIDIPDDLWPVEADSGQMGQVIGNIAINAKQAMPSGGTVKISLRNIEEGEENDPSGQPKRYIEISIKDEGYGIPEEYLSKIFDPYFTTKQDGSGLGLASCYSIVRKHEGTIDVESKVGSGAVFHIRLSAVEKAGDGEPPCRKGVVRGKGRVLVMDDEEMIREMACEMLKELGYEVESASDGKEALELYSKARERKEHFDAVIMDLTVPGGMGGREAVERLRAIDPQARVVVSSGYSNDPVLSNYESYGFKGVVIKPYSLEDFSITIYNVIINCH